MKPKSVKINKQFRLAIVAVAVGFTLSAAGVAVAQNALSDSARNALSGLQNGPMPNVAETSITSSGSEQEIQSAKSEVVRLVNADINLDGVTRASLDDSAFVSSEAAKAARLQDVSAVWATSGVTSRAADIQNGIEAASADSTFKNPMESGEFVIAAWHGVSVSSTKITAVVFGHELENTSARTVQMPDEYLQVEAISENGAWKLISVSHRMVGSF